MLHRWVSMKSGLEGRNNYLYYIPNLRFVEGLNEVRPRRPEQLVVLRRGFVAPRVFVSMKSGLEGRNNQLFTPETGQLTPVSMKSGLEGRNNTRPGTWMVSPMTSQ